MILALYVIGVTIALIVHVLRLRVYKDQRDQARHELAEANRELETYRAWWRMDYPTLPDRSEL